VRASRPLLRAGRAALPHPAPDSYELPRQFQSALEHRVEAPFLWILCKFQPSEL
jgi:hypothetical protein